MTCTRHYNGAPGYESALAYNTALGYDDVGYNAAIDYDSATWWNGAPGYNADLPYEGCDEQPSSDSKSGYWRLFFTQLQEESLKPQVKLPEKEQAVEGKLYKQELLKTVERSKPRQSQKVKVQEIHQKQFFSRGRDNDVENLLQVSWLLSAEIRSILLSVPHYATMLRIKESELKQAANDADIRVRLLLLAA